MKSLFGLAALGIIGLAFDASAQKPEVTKAMYMVTGLH